MTDDDLDDDSVPFEYPPDWWCDFCEMERPNGWVIEKGNWLICYTCQNKRMAAHKEEAKRVAAEYYAQTNQKVKVL